MSQAQKLDARRSQKPTATLRLKLLLGYGGTLTASVLLVLWSLISLQELGEASGAILSENYRSIAATNTMTDAIARQERSLYCVACDSTRRASAERTFHVGEAQFLQSLGRARDNITIDGEQAILDAIEARYTEFLMAGTRQLRIDPGVDARGLEDDVIPAADRVLAACGQLRDINERAMHGASDSAALLARRAIWTTAAVGSALIALGLAVALVTSRRAAQPLEQLLLATKNVAEGDYRVQVPVTTRDEIGALAREFNVMVSQLAHYEDLNVQRLVSEIQKSDAVLRSLDDGIVVLDEKNVVSAINPAAARLFGVTSAEAIGKHFLEVYRHDRLFDIVKRSPTDATSPRDADEVVPLVVGTEKVFCTASLTEVDSPSGESRGKVLLLRDVTRFEQLDQLKSDFVSTASHELRGPLTSVAMSVALLQETVGPRVEPKERELLDAAAEEVARLRALVSDLLDLSKIESGRLELSFVGQAPAAVVARIVEIFEAQASRAGVSLTSKVVDDLPDVRVDATKISWVLSNLVSNALRYTSEGGAIEIAAIRAGRHVHFSVRDTGVGIPPDVQGRIFDKFVRVGPDKSSAGGTGLGLAICKEIVRAHGGTIWVDSTPGKGSTFTFTVPVDPQGEQK